MAEVRLVGEEGRVAGLGGGARFAAGVEEGGGDRVRDEAEGPVGDIVGEEDTGGDFGADGDGAGGEGVQGEEPDCVADFGGEEGEVVEGHLKYSEFDSM